MKKITLIGFISFISIFTKAQTPVANAYYTNSYINKFEGNWQWLNGTDTVVIKLKKIKRTNTKPIFYDDVLVGCHQYVKNGQLMESSLNLFDSLVLNNGRKKTILGWYHQFLNDTSKIECTISDITKHTRHKLILQYVSTNPPTLLWTLSETEGILADPQQQIGLTLPSNLVLTKQ